jgi:hypothetical protein
VLGFEVPTKVPDVPKEVLSPRGTWFDAAAYDAVMDTVKAIRWLGYRTARAPWIIWLPRARNKILGVRPTASCQM